MVNYTKLQEELWALEARELELTNQATAEMTANLIYYFNRPNPIQAEILEAWLDDDLKVFIASGANRIGKTTILTIIGHSTLFGKFPWSGQRLPFSHNLPRKVRYVGQDWDKHIAKVVIPALEKWWPKKEEVIKKKNHYGIDALWTHKRTGSTLEIMSNKQESDLHEGWEGDLVLYDEPPKRDVRVANARGLVDREGREFFACTLLKEAWIHQDVIKRRNDDGTPDRSIFAVNADITVNIGYGISEKGVDQFTKTLTDEEKDARLKGVPSYMAGLIYPQFDRKAKNRGGHMFDRPKTWPRDWPVDIAIDTHPRESQAILFVSTSPHHNRYVIDEIFEHGDGKWIGEQIFRKIEKHKYRVNAIICDPAAKGDQNSENTTFDKIDDTLIAYGINPERSPGKKGGIVIDIGSKDLDSGIIAVKDHLFGPNKEASLFFSNYLVRTILEIERYMWDPDTGKPKDGRKFHMLENLRRILLLDTQFTPIDLGVENEDEDGSSSWTGSKVAGY